MNPSEWVERYRDIRPQYEKLTRKIRSLLEEILEHEGVKATFESRTKDVDSFREKITRPGKSYLDPVSEITDLSGIRVVLYSLADVERVARLVGTELRVDPNLSINKLDQLDPDKFGYLSQHYIVQVSESRQELAEWADLSNLRAEVQVRTVLQHAWATVEHFLVYKNKMDAPRTLRRRLSRLSALFELADEELDHIIQERRNQTVGYKAELDEGNTQIEINVDSLRAYVQNSNELKYWAQYLRDKVGIRVDENDWGDLSRDVRFAQFFELNSMNDVDNILKNAHGWGEQFFFEYFDDRFKSWGVSADAVSAVINAPVTMLMIASNAERITTEAMEKDFGWGDGQVLLDYALKARGNKAE